jgi:hypothetical protein
MNVCIGPTCMYVYVCIYVCSYVCVCMYVCMYCRLLSCVSQSKSGIETKSKFKFRSSFFDRCNIWSSFSHLPTQCKFVMCVCTYMYVCCNVSGYLDLISVCVQYTATWLLSSLLDYLFQERSWIIFQQWLRTLLFPFTSANGNALKMEKRWYLPVYTVL